VGKRGAKTTPEGKPWAIYARLSKAATGDLEKVEYQVELCGQYAASRGLPVDDRHTYPETTACRPGRSGSAVRHGRS
jgi:hypothetical protein